MADDFSQSLTPPVSPFASDSLCELTPTQPPCFCCSETKDEPTGALTTEGYAARGSLKRYSHCQFTEVTHTQNILPLRGQFLFLCANEIHLLHHWSIISDVCPPYRLLLHLDPAPTEYETDTVEIFGFPWVTETALVESTKVLFGLFR